MPPPLSLTLSTRSRSRATERCLPIRRPCWRVNEGIGLSLPYGTLAHNLKSGPCFRTGCWELSSSASSHHPPLLKMPTSSLPRWLFSKMGRDEGHCILAKHLSPPQEHRCKHPGDIPFRAMLGHTELPASQHDLLGTHVRFSV